MKYYQNKTTGEIIGICNMRDLISHPTEKSEKAGYNGYSYQVIYDMVCPNKLLGNGIVSYCITHSYLSENYKRINKKTALSKYPEFKQYKYSDLIDESEKTGVAKLDILQKQTF